MEVVSILAKKDIDLKIVDPFAEGLSDEFELIKYEKAFKNIDIAVILVNHSLFKKRDFKLLPKSKVIMDFVGLMS